MFKSQPFFIRYIIIRDFVAACSVEMRQQNVEKSSFYVFIFYFLDKKHSKGVFHVLYYYNMQQMYRGFHGSRQKRILLSYFQHKFYIIIKQVSLYGFIYLTLLLLLPLAAACVFVSIFIDIFYIIYIVHRTSSNTCNSVFRLHCQRFFNFP